MNLAPADTDLMNRLFGPRIPDEMAAVYEEAKAVDMTDIAHIGDALTVLLSSIVHTGIGDGAVGGWRLYEADGSVHLAVCRINLAGLKAA